MDYYVMGTSNEVLQERISDSFKRLGFDTSKMHFCFDNWIYYSFKGDIYCCCNDTMFGILETHQGYQILPISELSQYTTEELIQELKNRQGNE